MSKRRAEGDDLIVERSGEHTLGGHVQMAHATFKGEHQIAEYVARLEIGECAKILAATAGPVLIHPPSNNPGEGRA